LASGESTEIDFNITNTHNVFLDLYGYSTKGTLEIFDEVSQKWVTATNLQPATKIIKKTKFRLKNVNNQQVQIHFILVDSASGKSYQTQAKSIWVGSFNADYIKSLNDGVLRTSDVLTSTVSAPVLNLTEATPVNVDTTGFAQAIPLQIYIGGGLLLLSCVTITLIVLVMIKYTNAQSKKMATCNNNDANNICSIIDPG
jgi:hypothetical protein